MPLCDPWILPEDLAGCDCDVAALESGRLEELIQAASGVLYELSSGLFGGLCTSVWRPPCHQTAYNDGLPYPVSIGGQWMNIRGCGCGVPLLLPYDYPHTASVVIDGAPFSSFRLENRILWRSDGAPWPCCQNLSLPDTAPDTWAVTVLHGLVPPIMGQLAARALTAELVKDCTGAECKLPRGTTTFTRQGISGQIGLNQSPFGDQLLQAGIYEVDLFLAAYPSGKKRRGRFWSPDVPATLGG